MSLELKVAVMLRPPWPDIWQSQLWAQEMLEPISRSKRSLESETTCNYPGEEEVFYQPILAGVTFDQ